MKEMDAPKLLKLSVKVTFLHKGMSVEEVEARDGFTAILVALNTLTSTEMDNIKSIEILEVK
jgi:hypothetical protein